MSALFQPGARCRRMNLKYEVIYIQGYDTVSGLHHGLARYFAFYNDERPHQSLDHRTPAAVYRGTEVEKG